MTPHDFVTWLRGVAATSPKNPHGDAAPSAVLWKTITDELEKVSVTIVPPPVVPAPSYAPTIWPGPYVGDLPRNPHEVTCGQVNPNVAGAIRA